MQRVSQGNTGKHQRQHCHHALMQSPRTQTLVASSLPTNTKQATEGFLGFNTPIPPTRSPSHGTPAFTPSCSSALPTSQDYPTLRSLHSHSCKTSSVVVPPAKLLALHAWQAQHPSLLNKRTRRRSPNDQSTTHMDSHKPSALLTPYPPTTRTPLRRCTNK